MNSVSKTLIFYWPVLLMALLLVATGVYFNHLDDSLCTNVAGLSASIWVLMFFCFGVPAFIGMVSFYIGVAGYHAFKQGVYPSDTGPPLWWLKRSTGWCARFKAYSSMITPLLGIALMIFGLHTFNQVIGDDGVRQMQAEISSDCQAEK